MGQDLGVRCQRCCQPLKLRQPLGVLHPAQGEPQETQEAGASSRPLADGGGMSPESASFTLLGKVASVRTLSSLQKAAADISDILSGQEAVQEPLCEECTDTLLQQLDAQLSATELDNLKYRRCLEATLLMGEDEREAQQAELQALELEERRLALELEELEQEHARTAEDLRAAQAETVQLQLQEQQHRRDHSALEWRQLELRDELSSVENRLRHAQAQLARLGSTSAWDLAFQIWEEGPLGVINHFRLGRLPGVPVRWAEINAAWGQVALLLLALAKALGLRFRRYRLVARGSRSYLRSLAGDPAELPLFSDESQNVFLDNRFDLAMLAFLDCLRQFEEEAEKGEAGLRLPYRTHAQQGLMEDPQGGETCSLRTHLNTEEQWTQALRFMLLNLRCSLAWASMK